MSTLPSLYIWLIPRHNMKTNLLYSLKILIFLFMFMFSYQNWGSPPAHGGLPHPMGGSLWYSLVPGKKQIDLVEVRCFFSWALGFLWKYSSRRWNNIILTVDNLEMFFLLHRNLFLLNGEMSVRDIKSVVVANWDKSTRYSKVINKIEFIRKVDFLSMDQRIEFLNRSILFHNVHVKFPFGAAELREQYGGSRWYSYNWECVSWSDFVPWRVPKWGTGGTRPFKTITTFTPENTTHITMYKKGLRNQASNYYLATTCSIMNVSFVCLETPC